MTKSFAAVLVPANLTSAISVLRVAVVALVQPGDDLGPEHGSDVMAAVARDMRRRAF